MNYITDYQLDIDRGFQCRVNNKVFNIYFNKSIDDTHWFLTDQFNKLLIELKLDPNSVVKPYGTLESNHLVYCDSKQKCYDLCQHIVDTYFKSNPFTKNDEEFTVEIDGEKHTFFLTKNVLFYWNSKTIDAFHFNDHISLTEVGNICYILKINKYKHHNGKIGFETKEDAVKFAKYVIQYHYPRNEIKEWGEKSRRHLLKYYSTDQCGINLPEKSFSLRRYNESAWYWHNNNLENATNCIYSQFRLSKEQVLEICNKLDLSCILQTTIPTFENPNHAIKFTDYLIETYIIKKEKNYENQLRKKRASLSRGAKPAGSIIHGRRSKASVRCGCIEHKACLGN